MKEEVKSLWRKCFDDSETFLEFYFTHKYADSVNIAIQEDNQLVAAMQMLPYPMNFCGESLPTAYISGACTHPDFRGKGVMKQLLGDAMKTMYHRKELFVTLIPANAGLFDYYSRSGFANVFDYSVYYINVLHLNVTDDYEMSIYTSEEESVFYHFFQSTESGHGRIQHTLEDVRAIIIDLTMANGSLYLCKKSGVVIGYLFAEAGEKNTMVVKAMEFKGDLYARISTIRTAVKAMKKELIVEVLDKVDKQFDTYPLGMARIINAEEVLKRYASQTSLTTSFELIDEELPINNGHYMLHDGICVKSSLEAKESIAKVTVAELTQAVLGYHIESLPPVLRGFATHTPYMNLMLN